MKMRSVVFGGRSSIGAWLPIFDEPPQVCALSGASILDYVKCSASNREAIAAFHKLKLITQLWSDIIIFRFERSGIRYAAIRKANHDAVGKHAKSQIHHGRRCARRMCMLNDIGPDLADGCA